MELTGIGTGQHSVGRGYGGILKRPKAFCEAGWRAGCRERFESVETMNVTPEIASFSESTLAY